VLEVAGEDCIGAIFQPVTPCFADAVAARAVSGLATSYLAQLIGGLVDPGRDEAARMHREGLEGLGDVQLLAVGGFTGQRRRMENDRLAKVGGEARKGAGAELGERMASAIGKLDVVPGLRATTVANHKVGAMMAAEKINGRALALVTEAQANRDDRTSHEL